MPKYLIQASYTSDGVKGLLKDGGSKRRAAAATALKSVGGKLEAFYFALGESDVVAIAEVPDNTSAVALSLAVNASGALATRTIALLTPEEMDQATKKTITFKAPGK